MQFTRVNYIDSSAQEIQIGASQGSCLGPLLIFICVKDLPMAVKNSKVSMLAGNACLYHQPTDIFPLNKAVNEALTNVDN